MALECKFYRMSKRLIEELEELLVGLGLTHMVEPYRLAHPSSTKGPIICK